MKNFQPMENLELPKVNFDCDSMEKFLRLQEILMESYYVQNLKILSILEKQNWTKDITIAIEDEISELRGQINWKWWKKDKLNVNEKELKFEIIDIFFFILSLM